jgi:hypothetical protein
LHQAINHVVTPERPAKGKGKSTDNSDNDTDLQETQQVDGEEDKEGATDEDEDEDEDEEGDEDEDEGGVDEEVALLWDTEKTVLQELRVNKESRKVRTRFISSHTLHLLLLDRAFSTR